jgi:hypothetical protein
MNTSDIKKILAKDPNAVFLVKQRHRTYYATITEVVEREVPVYSDWSGKQTGTRTSVYFNVLGSVYKHGIQADKYREERVPSYTLEKSHWIKPRDIQSQFDFGTGETLQQWIANEDRQMKSDWQASKDEATAKQDQVKALVRHISSPTVTDKEWDDLSDELSRLSLETLQLLTQHIASLV